MAPEPREELEIALLSDDELRRHVEERLEDRATIQHDWIDVSVDEGRVTLAGRVGSDLEIEAAETLIRDELGVADLQNELLVDELHRGVQPEDPVEAETARESREGVIGGSKPQQTSSSEHLSGHAEAEASGTRDPREAVEGGVPYSPPEGPAGSRAEADEER